MNKPQETLGDVRRDYATPGEALKEISLAGYATREEAQAALDEGKVPVGTLIHAATESDMTVKTDTAGLRVELPAPSYHLVATDEKELAAAHAKMVGWAMRMGQAVWAELEENKQSFAIAEANGWGNANTFKNRVRVLEQRNIFYSKIESALRQGFIIVPNFQMRVFAIRTSREKPVPRSAHGRTNVFEQGAQQLPEGQGEFKSNMPTVQTHEIQGVKDTRGEGTHSEYWQEPVSLTSIDFPIALGKPQLMSITQRESARKLFDELGISEDTAWRGGRAGDPILLGRLRNPRPGRPDVTFFLGWNFDPSRI